MADSEKGRTASLSALVSEYERRISSRPSKEEHDRLRTEVSAAKVYIDDQKA